MTVGHGLADARRKLGLSLDALASQTGYSIEVLRSIEETDLPRLPTGASLNAAIGAYAAAVHLDPEATSERYVASLPIMLSTAEALTAFEAEANEEAEPNGSGLFVYESAYNPRLSQASAHPAAEIEGPALLLHADPDPGSPSLVVSHGGGTSGSSPLAGRASRFSLALVFLVSALAAAGGYLLSARGDWWTRDRSPRSSRLAADGGAQARQPDPNVAHAIAPNAPPSPPVPAANSTQAESTAPSEPAAPSDSRNTSLQSNEAVAKKPGERTTTAANRRAATGGDPPVPSAVIIVPGSWPSSAPAATTSPPAPGELSGSWSVIVHDEASTAEADRNKVAYYLRLDQRGTQVGGSGYRVSEDGAESASSQQPVVVRGTLSGERLTLDFSGQNREHFVLYRSDNGVFRGRFRRDGAPPAGRSVVTLSPRAPVQ